MSCRFSKACSLGNLGSRDKAGMQKSAEVASAVTPEKCDWKSLVWKSKPRSAATIDVFQSLSIVLLYAQCHWVSF
jgi:hypothetical protein